MDLEPKKLYFPGYNLLFDIIAIPSEVFFKSIDEFVNACSILHWVLLFSGLSLWGLSFPLVHPTLNLCTHWLTVDFVITFYTLFTTYILAWISLFETFSCFEKLNNTSLLVLGHSRWCHCHCYFSHHHVIFNQLLQNFACARNFGTTVSSHVENGWATQNFWNTP